MGFVIVITRSINQAQSQKQWSTESDVLLLEKVNIRHFEGNADAWLFTWKENLVPFLSKNLSVWTSSLCIPVKIYYVCIIHESIAALNNPSYHRFRKKQDISSSSECLSNLAHSTCIVQAPISYIFITLLSLSHCAMNADETHIFWFIFPRVCGTFTDIWLLQKQAGHANSTTDVSRRTICICELTICASSMYLHFGTALDIKCKFKE